jgi:hypothetical protein
MSGTLSIVRGTLNGKAISPSFGTKNYTAGLTQAMINSLSRNAAGRWFQIDWGSSQSPLDGNPLVLSSVALGNDDEGEAAHWPVAAPGSYIFFLSYRIPPIRTPRSSLCDIDPAPVPVRFQISP